MRRTLIRLVRLMIGGAGCGSLLASHRPPPHPRHIPPGERGHAYGQQPAPAPLLTARVLAVRIADDDGQRAARVTADDVTRWLAFANDVFAPAGVRFLFRPAEGD